MFEFEIGENKYRAGKLNAFQQTHIVRRIAPVVAVIGASLANIKSDPLKAFQPIAEAFSKLSDEDVEYIQILCLSVIKRKQGEIWSTVYVPGGGMSFDDITLLELNEIVFFVLKDNLSSFFLGLVQRGYIPEAKE